MSQRNSIDSRELNSGNATPSVDFQYPTLSSRSLVLISYKPILARLGKNIVDFIFEESNLFSPVDQELYDLLIFDDEPMFRQLYREYIEMLNLPVICYEAGTAQEAIRLLESHELNIRIMIQDWFHPHGEISDYCPDGNYEEAEKRKWIIKYAIKCRPAIKIIVYSGHSECVAPFIHHGVFYYASKPVKMGALETILLTLTSDIRINNNYHSVNIGKNKIFISLPEFVSIVRSSFNEANSNKNNIALMFIGYNLSVNEHEYRKIENDSSCQLKFYKHMDEELKQIILDQMRESDIAAYSDNHMFSLLLPSTNLDMARAYAVRLQSTISKKKKFKIEDFSVHIRTRIGIGVIDESITSFQELIRWSMLAWEADYNGTRIDPNKPISYAMNGQIHPY